MNAYNSRLKVNKRLRISNTYFYSFRSTSIIVSIKTVETKPFKLMTITTVIVNLTASAKLSLSSLNYANTFFIFVKTKLRITRQKKFANINLDFCVAICMVYLYQTYVLAMLKSHTYIEVYRPRTQRPIPSIIFT